MSKLEKVLEELMRSIRKSNFRQNDPDITREQPKTVEQRDKSDAADTYEINGHDLIEDIRPVERPDGFQVEMDKINERIRQAKALTPQDMRQIEETLAKQDIQKDIFRSRMMMRSDEALEKQKITRKEPEKELTAREKFKARFMKDNEREDEH